LLGATISKVLLAKLKKEKFVVVVEVLLAVSGVEMVVQALLSLR
jgi:hypothetical protein